MDVMEVASQSHKEDYESFHSSGHQGNCADNTFRLIERLAESEADISKFKIAVMWYSPYPLRPRYLSPTQEILRERLAPTKVTANGSWTYHVFLLGDDNKAYDLWSKSEYLGQDFQTYVKELFRQDITYWDGMDRIRLNILPAKRVGLGISFGGDGQFSLRQLLDSLYNS